jgi:hypothetical protein
LLVEKQGNESEIFGVSIGIRQNADGDRKHERYDCSILRRFLKNLRYILEVQKVAAEVGK